MRSPETQAWMAMMWRAGMTQKNIARVIGHDHSGSLVCQEIKAFCETWTGTDVQEAMQYNNDRKKVVGRALNNYVKLYETIPSPDYRPGPHPHWLAAAIDEHAWLLRAEGVTFQEIGERLGVTRERARQRVTKFGRRIRRATRKCKFKLERTG
jgi:hypothetical protein